MATRKIKIISQVHLGNDEHGMPGDVVEVDEDIAEKIVQVERAEYVDEREPEPENRDPKPKRRSAEQQ
jgi:hypothetical protein